MDKLKLLKRVFDYEDTDEELLITYLPNAEKVLGTLTEQERFVLIKRFSGVTLKATGLALLDASSDASFASCRDITQRVRQIEGKALRKLKHPARRSILSGQINPIEMQETSTELLAKVEEFKAYSIDKMGLSARSQNCLQKAGIATVGQLILKTNEDLKDIKNLGRLSLSEITEILWSMGLSLRHCQTYVGICGDCG